MSLADVLKHSNILMPDSSNPNHVVATHHPTALAPYLNSFERHVPPHHQSLRIDFTPQKSAHDRIDLI
jgi:hypothetical protein